MRRLTSIIPSLAHVLVNEGGVRDASVICAALLHDTLEDTETTREELESFIGAKIAGIVAEVTDDKSLPKEERKRLRIEHAPSCSPDAKLVMLADKISNLRDILAFPPADWPLERRSGYFDWAKNVVEGLRGVNLALEAVFDSLYARRSELA